MLCNNFANRSQSQFDLLVEFKWSVLASMDHANSLAFDSPLLPIFFQFYLLGIDLFLVELTKCHVRVKLSISFEVWNCLHDQFVKILDLLVGSLWHDEHGPVRKGVKYPKSDLKCWEIV